jgi:hypothetical protein
MAKVAKKEVNRISSNGSGKAPKIASVVLKEPNFPVIELTVEGTSMLVQNAFSEKIRRQLLEAQLASDKPQKTNHKARCLEDEVSEACHWFDPSLKPEFTFIEKENHKELALIESDRPMIVRSDCVRLKNGQPYERFRPSWPNWSCRFAVEYNADVLNAADVVNLFHLAGKSVGVGEGRPEKGGDDWGRYHVVTG